MPHYRVVEFEDDQFGGLRDGIVPETRDACLSAGKFIASVWSLVDRGSDVEFENAVDDLVAPAFSLTGEM